MDNVFKFFRETSFARFFIPLGIILIVFGIFAAISINNTKDYIKTEAVVSRTELAEEEYYDGENHHEATYTVYVKYTVDGMEYDEEYGVFSEYKVGDKVTISYNPNNPSEVAQPNTFVLPLVLIVLGIASLVGGVISIIKFVKKSKMMKKQEEGWANAN